MRICIIGAGFFGLHLARSIARQNSAAEVTIVDACGSVFMGAAGNNQCRLHLGFHYPRSGPTIYQALNGFERFISEYRSACHAISDNNYLIHRDSYVSVEQYFAVMDAFHLNYKQGVVPAYVHNQNDIECAVVVDEMYVNLEALKNRLLDDCKARFLLGLEIHEIDSEAGRISGSDRFNEAFDFVINATYTNLNMGFSQSPFEVTYEMACMVHARTNLSSNSAVTIMDGPFVSVYPASVNTHTFSSVTHTPFFRTNDYSELKYYIAHGDYKCKDEARDICNRVLNHTREYLTYEIYDQEAWFAPKVKLAGAYGDSRETQVKREGRLISVLCGKLDAAFSASDTILEVIR